MHLDRLGEMKSGSILNLQKKAAHTGLLLYADMFSPGFVDHLEKLCSQGLSQHGWSYLIEHLEPRQKTRTDLILNELGLEFIRWKHEINKPSRFQSLFAWDNIEDAIKFVTEEKAFPTIYEVEAQGRFFRADMNLSRRSRVESVLKYWRREPLDNSEKYTPIWECVLELPVKVIRQIETLPIITSAS